MGSLNLSAALAVQPFQVDLRHLRHREQGGPQLQRRRRRGGGSGEEQRRRPERRRDPRPLLHRDDTAHLSQQVSVLVQWQCAFIYEHGDPT